jgi:hypothetical protein
MFRIFQDCEKTLDPTTADLFEREANNFARFVLFQGDGYAKLAADCKFELKTPMKLAKRFGASVYASAREFARTSPRWTSENRPLADTAKPAISAGDRDW